MWILFKNISRYVFKKRFSLLGLMILILIAITIFVTFGYLGTNLTNSYTNLVKNGNLHNIVIDENFKSKKDQTEFEEQLSNLGVAYRQFNSLNITTTNSKLFKVIDYQPDAQIDKLIVYQSQGLPLNQDQQPTLPTGLNFKQTLLEAQTNFIIKDPSLKELNAAIKARQALVAYAALADWGSKTTYLDQFQVVNQIINANPEFDPLFPTNLNHLDATQIQDVNDVATYLNVLLNPNNKNYTPPVVTGYRISFDLTNIPSNTFNIPILGYFDDYSAFVAVVSPTYLQDNHKEIYSFQTYATSILNSNSKSPLDEQAFLNYFASIPDQYKIYVNQIPYVIVGSGISPDFMYPIINFQNVIPNPDNQAIIYTNQTGYQRVQYSFPTAPTENMLVAKYSGPKKLDDVIEEVNVLAHKYMSFPSNFQIAYSYDNINNEFSPTGLRVSFVIRLVKAVKSISSIISIFVAILALIVMVLFTKKFIEDNKTNIAIMLANGFNKIKVISSISLISFIPAFFGGLIGFLIGFFVQGQSISIFGNYWMIPTPIEPFNVGYLILCIVLPIIVFFLLTFILSLFILKVPVVEMMKDTNTFKLGFITIFFKKMMEWAPTIVKFRFSLAFAAISKIAVLTFVSTLTGVIFLFISSTSGSFKTVTENSLKTNKSTFEINLVTPTIMGGQYVAQNFNQTGQLFYPYNNQSLTPLNDLGYNQMGSLYSNDYKNLANFRTWAGMFWPSMNNGIQIKQDPVFLKNRTSLQMMLNNRFGIGNLSSNPWNTILALIPSNQVNASINLNNELIQAMLSSMQPINWAYLKNINPDVIGIKMPSQWVIANIGVSNPDQWINNYDESQNYGVINAQTIPGFQTLNEQGILSLSDDDIVQLINQTYPGLFSYGAISNVQTVNKDNKTLLKFSLNTNLNAEKYLVTDRTIFKQYFSIQATNNNQTDANISYTDPFALKEGKKVVYIPNNSTIMISGLPLKYSAAYINYLAGVLSNPYYQQFLYKFTYDSVTWNDAIDEPYTWINAQINDLASLHSGYKKHDDVQITGIVPDSKFIHLVNQNNQPINNLLFEPVSYITYNQTSYPVYNLIVNEYAKKLYNLHLNQIISINPLNNVNRYNPNFKTYMKDGLYKTFFKVVGVNNTIQNSQFYTSMFAAQNALGLATAHDYSSRSTNPMNNEYNPFGGFNGIFTNNKVPLTLVNNIALYSPSGLYPGTSGFENNLTFKALINYLIETYDPNVSLNEQSLKYIFNALYIALLSNDASLNNQTYNQLLNNIYQLGLVNKQSASYLNAVNALSDSFINQLVSIYGNIAFNSIVQKPIALNNTAEMFNNLSTTIEQIEAIIASIIIVLSLIMIMLISWMLMQDLIKIAALLKTQGYSDFSNAMNFFSMFIPTWLFTAILTIPFTYLALYFFKEFVFVNIGALLVSPVNWWAYVLIIVGLAGVYGVFFVLAMRFLKKVNIVEVLKW